MLRAEKKIRHWAEIFPNSYLIGIYACCRQLYSPNLSTGIFSDEQKDEYLNDIGAKKKEYDNRIKELEAELEKLEEQKKRIIEGNENEKQESSEEEKEFKLEVGLLEPNTAGDLGSKHSDIPPRPAKDKQINVNTNFVRRNSERLTQKKSQDKGQRILEKNDQVDIELVHQNF